MLKTVTGVYENGQIELAETPQVTGRARVIVTFLDDAGVDLRAHGIDEEAATDLRWRLNTMAEDWDRPEMSVYDAL
jgi:hypothetical protein